MRKMLTLARLEEGPLARAKAALRVHPEVVLLARAKAALRVHPEVVLLVRRRAALPGRAKAALPGRRRAVLPVQAKAVQAVDLQRAVRAAGLARLAHPVDLRRVLAEAPLAAEQRLSRC